MIGYDHYNSPLRCLACKKPMEEDKPRAGCRIFRRCCHGDPLTVFIAWKNLKDTEELGAVTGGLLGVQNELEFINRYCEVAE